jgi:hypothetical protein
MDYSRRWGTSGWLLSGIIWMLWAAAPAAPAASVEALVETDGRTFRVVDQQRRAQPSSVAYRQPLREGDLYVESLDANGHVVHIQSVPNPTEVVYDYAEGEVADGPQPLKGGRLRRPTAQFRVHIPEAPAVRALRISRQRRVSATSTPTASTEAARRIPSRASADAPPNVQLDYQTTLVLEPVR